MTKQDKDPDGGGPVDTRPPGPPPQTRSQRPSGNSNSSSSPTAAPATAATQSDHKSAMSSGLDAAGKQDNPNIIIQQSPASTQHPSKALPQYTPDQAKKDITDGSSFLQPPPPPNVSFDDEFREAQDITYEKLCEMVKDSDLDSFLAFRDELLSVEESLGPGSNYLPLKQSLYRIELAIRGANIIKSNRETAAASQMSSTEPNVPEVEDAVTVEAEPSKKRRKRKKKTGHGAVIADSTDGEAASADTPKINIYNDPWPWEDNDADLEQTIRIESSLAELQSAPDSFAQLEEDFKTDELLPPGDAEAPRKKGKKRRGKKKAQGGIDKGKQLAENKSSAAATSSPSSNLPSTGQTSAEHTCDHKQHARCSHTTWKNDDTNFSKVLAETIRELLSDTPLDSKLKLELHVDMNKVKRRVDEIEAADGDATILSTKKQLSSASNKAPFSAFGKVVTPKEQRAAAIHLLSSPKYYNAFLDYIEHLNYLVACGDEKAAAMADEADLIYHVVTKVYKEVSDNTRSKVDDTALIESVTHAKRLAESAKKMRELQELEQGIRRPDDPTPAAETSGPVCGRTIRDNSPASAELETKALSLIKQPPVLRRFVADYNAMGTNSDAYGSFWGQESHLLYQKLVDMKAVPNFDKQPFSLAGRKPPSMHPVPNLEKESSSKGSRTTPSMHPAPNLEKQPSSEGGSKMPLMHPVPNLENQSLSKDGCKAPLTPKSAIDSLAKSTSGKEAFSIISEYFASHTVTPEFRQTVASYYAFDDAKMSAFLLEKAAIEERFNSSKDAKLGRVRDEVEKLWVCIVEERKARELEDSEEVESESRPIICNPSKTKDFVDKVMRKMVKQFARSTTGIRRFLWPLKFIAEHPSIQETTRAASVCVLTDMSQLSRYAPYLRKAKNMPWNQPTLSNLGAQQHVQHFMDAVGSMKTALESAPPSVLRYNANRNPFILPITKRAGVPIKAQILYNIRDYDSAYIAALDDEGRASVNRDFRLPAIDCPNYFRETAKELYDNAVDYAAFIEQKNNLANLPACFGDVEVRQSLVASALLLHSALAELDDSSPQDRLRIMEVVAASSSYAILPPAIGSVAICRDTVSSYLSAVLKVETNFVREDTHYQVAGDKSGDESAGSKGVGVHSKEHVPYVLGRWMPNAMAGEQISGKPSVAQEPVQPPQPTPINHRIPEATSEPPEELTPSQKKLKKELIAANYRKQQTVPLTQHEVRARARGIISDSSMLSSFKKSKEAMEYDTGFEDNVDEKFFKNEMKRICAEMKKMKVDMDAGIGPQEPARPISSFMPPPTAQLSAPKDVDDAIHLPKSSVTLVPPRSIIKSPVDCVSVHHLDFQTCLDKRVTPALTPTPTPMIPRDRVVVYSPLGLPAHFDTSMRPNAAPLPSDPELAKECIIFETARAQRKSLAAYFAKSFHGYAYFLEFKAEAEEAAVGTDPTTEEGSRARKILSVLDNVDSTVQMLRVGARRDAGKDNEHIQATAADLLSVLDDRPRLMIMMEAIEQLFDDESRYRNPAFSSLAGLKLSKRFDEMVTTVCYGLFVPEAVEDWKTGDQEQEPIAKQVPKIPRPESIIDNKVRPFIGQRSKRMPKFTDPADVLVFATDMYPGLSDLLSGGIPLSSCGRSDTAKLSEIEIQKVLGGLDSMPVPPQAVADLYKSRASVPVPKVPRFTNADEAVAYMQSQMEGATVPISVSVAPSLSRSSIQDNKEAGSSRLTDKYGDSVPDEYTVVPDSTPEGRALGKAMEDIQLSACKGDVPTDYQMAALGKARRELYDSRLAKPPATTGNPSTAKRHPTSLSVSVRAESRAATNLLARSEAMTLVGTRYFPNAQYAAPSEKPRNISFSPAGFALPPPAPQPLQIPSAPGNKPDALLVSLRTPITETPLIAAPITVEGVHREVNKLYTSINKSSDFHECRTSLRIPDPTSVACQPLLDLNRVFATYKAIQVIEERRLDVLLESAEEYQSSIEHSMEVARLWNRGLDAALTNAKEYRLFNKRAIAAMNGEYDEMNQSPKRRSRKSEKRRKGMGKKLGAHRKSIIEDFEDPVEYHGDGPKLGTFPFAR
ncbi:hypothetical protein VC83_02262 [Pseudogymnoascus destructans]|uniref:Uncharacterized protein n=2 Tax=Pseudogymnoascus destructans TaxID=655981 RepID=L8FZU9_PSED2|nr:uncharacterized protein VC83_02262 [Pseudogymnoascus destructans]ELR06034.1 hypothetical protein GMDG_07745 [Pseudogymnoascus destructans 20631-21]OAF61379.1 hypothetical protein VC83_02262 [Pseudogymnoascus destructans]